MQKIATPDDALFGGRALTQLLIPLLVEQFLILFIGLADTYMVSRLGESAISAVSLVDNINILMNQAFMALATGGSVIAAQYLGKGERSNACDAAKQLYITTVMAGLLIGLVVGLLHGQVLKFIFGDLEPSVKGDASVYLVLSACAYPFIGACAAGSAMYRAMGNSKTTMVVSAMLAVIKVAISAIAIYGLQLGVMGAAVSTLIARIVCAAVYMVWIKNPSNIIFIHDFRRIEWQPDLIRRILRIGIPTGIENGLFQIGKLLTLGLVNGIGQAAVASYSIASLLAGMFMLPGNTISLAMVTVIGHCMGAGDPDRASRLTYKLILVSIASLLVSQSAMYLLAPQLAHWYNLEGEALRIATALLVSYAPVAVFLWPFAFMVPSALRAAGDVRYTMVVAIISMGLLRVGLSYVFVNTMGLGVQGVWYAMFADWVGRAVFFCTRFARGKWKTIKVI